MRNDTILKDNCSKCDYCERPTNQSYLEQWTTQFDDEGWAKDCPLSVLQDAQNVDRVNETYKKMKYQEQYRHTLNFEQTKKSVRGESIESHSNKATDQL